VGRRPQANHPTTRASTSISAHLCDADAESEALATAENRRTQDLKWDSVLPGRFPCCYDAARVAASSIEGSQPKGY
jgi:hypothetical protein